MEREQDLELQQLKPELSAIAADILSLAKSCQGNTLALLDLLRMLEQLHREICESLFQTSLPDNRQELYALLRNIEELGGWPYIERMRLRSLLANLSSSEPTKQPESTSELSEN